jgi:hypothetical protein
MNRLVISAVIAALTISTSTAAAPSNQEVESRKIAMNLAGAFSNDGFKLRDGYWNGEIAPGRPKVIQVNLYAGNEYWFSAGATKEAKTLSVTVYDENGEAVDFEPYSDGSSAAAGFSPSISGPYYVRVEAMEGVPATFCLVYSYK